MKKRWPWLLLLLLILLGLLLGALLLTRNTDSGDGDPTVTADPTEDTSGPEQTDAPTQPPTDTPTQPPTEGPTDAPTEPPTEPPTEAPTQPNTCSHSWSAWTTQAATCDTNGVKTRKCSKCSKEETETIAATGHNWDSGKVTTTPTNCSDMGIKTYTCKTCGKTKTEQINGSHSFDEWQYEEYTYIIPDDPNNPHDGYEDMVVTSHRKYRTCTKCGYKEYGNTPDHYCAKGSVNHTVTKVKEGTCTIKAIMRSTCKICGWYVEYEGRKAAHTCIDETVHISDYSDYTNELDATLSKCTVCGLESVAYKLGKGWRDDENRYYVSVGTTSGSADTPVIPTNDNFAHIQYPDRQTVKRDFVYDSDGYVVQFTLYWWYNGQRYSQVIKCGKGEIEAWFAQFGLTGRENAGYSLKIYGTEVRPYSIGWSG